MNTNGLTSPPSIPVKMNGAGRTVKFNMGAFVEESDSFDLGVYMHFIGIVEG